MTIETTDECIHIAEGELLLIERSYKYNNAEIERLFDEAGLRLVNRWHHKEHDYTLNLVEKPAFYFPSTQLISNQGSNPFGLPSLEDWNKLWKAFDCVTLEMIPPAMLHTKPIDLRRKAAL